MKRTERAIIPENAMAVYEFSVPFSLDFKSVRTYLATCLEKLHPCFSERCEVDYRFSLMCHGQLTGRWQIQAFVIDRTKLLMLRKKYPMRILYQKDCLVGSRPKPVFSREALRRNMLVCMALPAIVLAAVLPFSLGVGRRTGTADVAEQPAMLMDAESAYQDGAGAAVGTDEADQSLFPLTDGAADEAGGAQEAAQQLESREYLQAFDRFFASLYGAGGSISFFSYDRNQQELVFKESGLYPEQVAALFKTEQAGFQKLLVRYGSVSYQESVPALLVTCSIPAEQPVSGDLPAEGANTLVAGSDPLWDGPAQLLPYRELFLESGGILTGESVNPPSLRGAVPAGAWLQFGDMLSEQLNAEPALTLIQFELSRQSRASPVSVAMTFAQAGDGQVQAVQLPVSSVARIMLDPVLVPEEAAPDEPVGQPVLPGPAAGEIGRVTREDGTVVIFMRNEEGRIERVVCKEISDEKEDE